MIESFTRLAFAFVNVSLLVVATGFIAPAMAGDLRLLMFDQPGCVYCQKWEAEIGPIYPQTEEAVLAPLTQIGIRDDLPEAISLSRPVGLTPTFVLVDDGREVGRMEGYPGEDFFWFLLGELIGGAEGAES